MSTATLACAPAASAVSFVPVVAAFVTAAISAFVAWFTARRTVHLESEKLRLGTQQKILEMLVKTRLEVYPKIYALLSNLWKYPPQQADVAAVLNSFIDELNEWDSKYSLILGPHTTNICYEFREVCNETLEVARSRPIDKKTYDEQSKKVFAAGQKLELALRSDIGIYGLQLTGPAGIHTPVQKSWGLNRATRGA